MDFKTAIFGQHDLSIWFASILWAFIGAIIVKAYYMPNKMTWTQFSLRIWIDENALDFIKSIVYAILILRLGDLAITLFEIYFEKLPIQIEDFVILNLFISIFIQNYLHKKRKR